MRPSWQKSQSQPS